MSPKRREQGPRKEAKGGGRRSLARHVKVGRRTADWLVDGGELGELIRATNWLKTALGPRERWPQPLRTVVNLVVESKLPMALVWGPELLMLYNDAFRAIAADAHPGALGRSARETWARAWHIDEPIFAAVMGRGDSLHFEDKLYPVERHGQREDAHFTLCYNPVRLADGAVGGILITLQETTAAVERNRLLRESEEKLREANARLAEADRGKAEFLAMLSHELRNPLAPIASGLYILDRAAPGGEQAHRAKAIIDRQVAHMSRLIDNLLDVTRLGRGETLLQRERLDLNELTRRTVDDHRGAFVQGGIDLRVSLDLSPVWVNGDRTRLTQLIGHLLQNAAKFTPRGGRTSVSLQVDTARGQATVSVQDTGRGIAPQLLPCLFEAFTQTDITIDRKLGGLGLGLTLVKGLVEMHGGWVSAASEGPGQGATFTVTLPLDAATPEERAQREAGAGALARRVLVIEDNVDAAESLREVLELDDHQVEVAYNGREGLEKARAFRPDVVLCDIGLPEMNGYEVAQALRAEPELGRVKLVALTGYAAPRDVDRARAAGFDIHLAKPITMDALQRVLRSSGP